MHEQRAPLNEQLKKLANWPADCQNPFEVIEKNVSSKFSLSQFDPLINIVAETNATQNLTGVELLEKF